MNEVKRRAAEAVSAQGCQRRHGAEMSAELAQSGEASWAKTACDNDDYYCLLG